MVDLLVDWKAALSDMLIKVEWMGVWMAAAMVLNAVVSMV
jgi:hypothetical protein